MRRLLLALPLLAAGCATASTPYAPVRNPAYQAMGGDGHPTWFLAIGDDRIVLRVVYSSDVETFEFPRTLPRTVDNVRTWESDNDEHLHLSVETRRSPCTDRGGQVFEDQVRVLWHAPWPTQFVHDGEGTGWEVTGCGGRLLRRKHDR